MSEWIKAVLVLPFNALVVIPALFLYFGGYKFALVFGFGIYIVFCGCGAGGLDDGSILESRQGDARAMGSDTESCCKRSVLFRSKSHAQRGACDVVGRVDAVGVVPDSNLDGCFLHNKYGLFYFC